MSSTKSKVEKSNSGKWTGAIIGGGIIAILVKFKSVLLVLLTKLKFAYVLLIFAHEMGHYKAANIEAKIAIAGLLVGTAAALVY